jgi:hypothetical protein
MLQRILVAVMGPHRLGRSYLADQLACLGVAKGRIPPACIRELADECMKAARFRARVKRRRRRKVAADYLEGRAAEIACVLDISDSSDASTEQYDEHVESILRKHGVLKDFVFLPFTLRQARRFR